MRDSSLEEFLDDAESDSGRDNPTPPPTSRWTTQRQPCPDCGGATRRLWQADGRLVCAECKDWG